MLSPPNIIRLLSQQIISTTDAPMDKSTTHSNSVASIPDDTLHLSSCESLPLDRDHGISATSPQCDEFKIPFLVNESNIDRLEYSTNSSQSISNISISPISLPSMNCDESSNGRPNIAVQQRKAKRLIKELANLLLFDESTTCNNHSVNGDESSASSHDTSLFWENRVIEYSIATTLIDNDLKTGSGTWENDYEEEAKISSIRRYSTFFCLTPSSEDNDKTDNNNNYYHHRYSNYNNDNNRTNSPDEFAQITNRCILHNTIRSLQYLERDDENIKRNPIDRFVYGIFELVANIADLGAELCGGGCDGMGERERDLRKRD